MGSEPGLLAASAFCAIGVAAVEGFAVASDDGPKAKRCDVELAGSSEAGHSEEPCEDRAVMR